jgi:phage-related protein
LFYRQADGSVPVKRWLGGLRRTDRGGFAKCVERIQRLAALGHELRRPHADFLRDGIYELRARRGTVNYRVLYFFHGKGVAVLAHGLTKKGKVPKADIDRVIRRRNALRADPKKHIYEEQSGGDDPQDN